MKELAYRFELQLDSSPEELRPLVSDAVLADAEVHAVGLRPERLDARSVKGFEREQLALWRVHA